MRRWLGRWLGLIILTVGVLSLAIWIYGGPKPAGLPCVGQERTIYANALVQEGYSIICKKEGDVSSFLDFRMRLWQQFTGWARTHSIATIYEQPGYFWFTIPAGNNGAEGFVHYEY